MPGRELVLDKWTSKCSWEELGWVSHWKIPMCEWMASSHLMQETVNGQQELLIAQTSQEQPQGGLSGLRAEVTFSEINNKNNKEYCHLLSTYSRMDSAIRVLYYLVQSYRNLKRKVLFQSYGWESRGLEKLVYLPNITWLARRSARNQSLCS